MVKVNKQFMVRGLCYAEVYFKVADGSGIRVHHFKDGIEISHREYCDARCELITQHFLKEEVEA
jgi:hypothetical protein